MGVPASNDLENTFRRVKMPSMVREKEPRQMPAQALYLKRVDDWAILTMIMLW